jgi:malate dehydrogenase
MPKISVIGAGNVGASLAQRLAEKAFADIVLLDIVEGLPQGKALDIMQTAPVTGCDIHITGSNDYADTAGSEVVVITCGASRKPGMTRDQLAKTNAAIIGEVTRNVAWHSPQCIIVMVTNPVDAMTSLALKASGFPPQRVVGLSGVLDSARLSSFIAEELNVPASQVSSLVIGEHGQHMVVIPRLSTADGQPITELLSPDKVQKLVERTVNGGAEIVALLKTGSAFYAPAASAARMVEAIVLDKKEVLPCVAYLHGEYNIKGVTLGVPVRLGKAGIEEIVELELTPEESQALAKSAEAVRTLIQAIDETG